MDFQVENADQAIRCAILTASKTQILNTVDGNQIDGISVPIGQLVKATNKNLSISDFFVILKRFLDVIELNNNSIKANLLKLIEQYLFISTFWRKFEQMYNEWSYLLEHNTFNKNQVKKVTWLLFILGRQYILNSAEQELVETAFLLISSLDFILTNINNNIGLGVKLCETINANSETWKNSETFNKLSEQLKHNNIDLSEYSNMATLDVRNLYTNLNRLYDQISIDNKLDERMFINNDGNFIAATPQKAAPFTRQPENNNQKFKFSKQINFLSINNKFHVKMNDNMKDIKFPSSVLSTPIIGSTPYRNNISITQTPISRAMNNYNWLNDMCGCYEYQQNGNENIVTADKIHLFINDSLINILNNIDENLVDEYQTRLVNMLDIFRNEIDSKTKINDDFNKLFTEKTGIINTNIPSNKYSQQIAKLYFKFLSALLHNDNQISLKNENFHKALILTCTETILYINNNNSLEFENLLKLQNVNCLNVWKILYKFLHIDNITNIFNIPVKRHLHDLELNIITELAWNQDSPILLLVKKYQQCRDDMEVEDNDDVVIDDPEKILFKKVTTYTAHRLFKLCELMQIDDLMEDIWNVLKHCLSHMTNLLKNRHLDQIIICSIYGVCKIFDKMNFGFKRLINKYNELTSEYDPLHASNQLSNKIIHKVYLGKDKERDDIIKFQNLIQVPEMKNFLFGQKNLKNKEEAKYLNGINNIGFSLLNPDFTLKSLNDHYEKNIQKNATFQIPSSPFNPQPVDQQNPYSFVKPTPRTKQLQSNDNFANTFKIGTSPPQQLRDINTNINKNQSNIEKKLNDGSKICKNKNSEIKSKTFKDKIGLSKLKKRKTTDADDVKSVVDDENNKKKSDNVHE